ncbi:protealysin inhibitor emfourin [Phycicoccus sp. Root101]|uniref:protealysin inhibitor emfourin n=1 Tax=Phycicoccus sp. Root101 TaxID=1736421 RepID=UPI0009E81130|nr:protealysin inhibitor emfourin [Phycicoccus sp. Root101]
MNEMSGSARCGIVPPYLLQALAAADGHAAASAEHTLRRDVEHRSRREGRPTAASPPRAAGGTTTSPSATGPAPDDGSGPQRVVGDAKGAETLPGTTVRREGEAATGDPAADEAYDGLGQTWSLYSQAYGRDSLDGKGLPLLATVHYGKDYDNAFWDGTQMVFGDGDGEVFNRFTVSVDVIGHELTHGVTELTAGLTYQGQSGALNESVSDVFGSLVRQRALGQSAEQADWLIGAGLFTADIKGVALRSMKAPGTAYDDPRLGKDPQPATMAGYVETTDDNGGVHTNSGIPNHAFYLAATAIGGNAWEAPGQIWFDTLTGDGIAADCDFATFARLTVAAATTRYGAGSSQATAVEQAWAEVGVAVTAGQGPAVPSPTAPSPTVPSPAPAPAELVQVRRTGGLAGMRQARTVALSELPEPDASQWRSLLAEDGLHALAASPGGRTIPDAFTYHVACPPDGDEVTLPEHGIPDPVRELFRRTLGD